MIHDLLFRLRALYRRRAMEADLESELQAHLEHQAEKYVRKGLSREEAERRAKFDFGDVEEVKKECRESWGVPSISGLTAGLQNGLRAARRSPAFTAAAVAALVVGFFVNVAIFNDATAAVQRLSPHQDSAHPVLAAQNTRPQPATVSPHNSGFVGPKVHSPAPARVRAPRRRREIVPAVRRAPALLKVTIVTVRAILMPAAEQMEEATWTSERGAMGQARLVLVSERWQQTRPLASGRVEVITVQFINSYNTVLEATPGYPGRPQEDVWRSKALSTSAGLSNSKQRDALTAFGQHGACTSVSSGLSSL